MTRPFIPNPLLTDFVSIVAGGSSGIGSAVVETLARHGSIVEFVANDAPGVRAVEETLRAADLNVCGTTLDVRDAEAVRIFVDDVAGRHGRIDVLVNSVGIQRYGTVISTTSEEWDEVLDVNLKSMFIFSKCVVPHMQRKRSGSIINVSSAQATASQQNVVAYTASKGAIVAMTRAMSMDHAGEGIRVNSVCPGSVDTPMLRTSAALIHPENPQRSIDEWGAGHPIGRVAYPEEVANAILFLASPLASFVTGEDLRVDGGVLAGVALGAPRSR